MDQQDAQRFQRIRSVQAQLSFRVARQVQTGRLAQRTAAANRATTPSHAPLPSRTPVPERQATASETILVRRTAT